MDKKIGLILQKIEESQERFLNRLLNNEEEDNLFACVLRLQQEMSKISCNIHPDLPKKFSKLKKTIFSHKNFEIHIQSKIKKMFKDKNITLTELDIQYFKNIVFESANRLDESLFDFFKNNDERIFKDCAEYWDLLEKVENDNLEREKREQKYKKDLLIKEELERKTRLIEFLERRKIKYLIHFTRIENLESILSNGFLSKSYMMQVGASFKENDPLRLDGKLDATCFSIEYPNASLFKTKQQNFQWVIVRLDVKLLYEHDGAKYYTYYNAATKSASEWLKGDFLSSLQAFKNMFAEEIPGYWTKTRTEQKLQGRDYLPTNEQAEVLIEGNIDSFYINKIYFKNEDIFEKFQNGLSDKSLLTCFDVEYNDDFYFRSRNEVNWEDR